MIQESVKKMHMFTVLPLPLARRPIACFLDPHRALVLHLQPEANKVEQGKNEDRDDAQF